MRSDGGRPCRRADGAYAWGHYDGEGHRTKVVETPAAGSPVTIREFAYEGDVLVAASANGTLVRSLVVDDTGSPTKFVVTNSGSTHGTPCHAHAWRGYVEVTRRRT